MLETIREFGLERLSARGEANETRDRHAAYFQELTAQAAPEIELGRFSTGWLARLDDERDNIRASLAWCIDQGEAERAQRIAGSMAEYWAFRSEFREGRAWCEQARWRWTSGTHRHEPGAEPCSVWRSSPTFLAITRVRRRPPSTCSRLRKVRRIPGASARSLRAGICLRREETLDSAACARAGRRGLGASARCP